MAIYADLSDYTYHHAFEAPGTKNIGWVGKAVAYPKGIAEQVPLAQILWKYCAVSVAQSRGLHPCDLCNGLRHDAFTNGDESLVLGSAEIRVFSPDGRTVFAAPNLIYHYVADHYYLPPEEFVTALTLSTPPPDESYFAALNAIGLEWNPTPTPIPGSKPYRLDLSKVKWRKPP